MWSSIRRLGGFHQDRLWQGRRRLWLSGWNRFHGKNRQDFGFDRLGTSTGRCGKWKKWLALVNRDFFSAEQSPPPGSNLLVQELERIRIQYSKVQKPL